MKASAYEDTIWEHDFHPISGVVGILGSKVKSKGVLLIGSGRCRLS